MLLPFQNESRGTNNSNHTATRFPQSEDFRNPHNSFSWSCGVLQILCNSLCIFGIQQINFAFSEDVGKCESNIFPYPLDSKAIDIFHADILGFEPKLYTLTGCRAAVTPYATDYSRSLACSSAWQLAQIKTHLSASASNFSKLLVFPFAAIPNSLSPFG